MKFRVGGLRAPLWGVVGSRERERGDLRGDASLRLSGKGPGTGAAGGLDPCFGGLAFMKRESRGNSQECTFHQSRGFTSLLTGIWHFSLQTRPPC